MSEATAAPAAPELPAAPVVPAVETAPSDVTATPSEIKPEAPPKTFTQKELDEILERRLGKERRKREELQRRLAVTEELALRSRPKEEAKPTEPDSEPKRSDFDSYEDYLEARAVWRSDKRVDEKLSKKSEEETRAKAQEEEQKLRGKFQESAKALATEIEDFDEVMQSSDAPMTKAMAEAILTSDIGVKVAYHLAKNPEEAERIAALPAPRQAAEIGKIEMKLSTPAKDTPTKKPSQAPEPIKPVGGSAVLDTGLTGREGMKEFIAKRNKQLGRR